MSEANRNLLSVSKIYIHPDKDEKRVSASSKDTSITNSYKI